jgi:hypothetical protein
MTTRRENRGGLARACHAHFFLLTRWHPYCVENIAIGSCYFVRILVGLRGSGKRTDDDFYISVPPSLQVLYVWPTTCRSVIEKACTVPLLLSRLFALDKDKHTRLQKKSLLSSISWSFLHLSDLGEWRY